MNRHAWIGVLAAAALVAGCADRGTVAGWVDKADGDCKLAKTELTHGLAYVDGSMLKHDGAAKVSVLLSDRSLGSIDLEKGFDPIFGAQAGSKQLYVIATVALHGLPADQLELVHPEKRCMTNMSDVVIRVDRFDPERVALTIVPEPPPEGSTDPRDTAQLTIDLPLQWPKDVPAAQREKMVAERAALQGFERDAVAAYREVVQAVAAGDVAAVEQRSALGGWSSMGSLLEELVFGAPDETSERAKLLPVVDALKFPSYAYMRSATAADADWELKLALCDPADAAKRGYAELRRGEGGRWLVADVRDDALQAASEFGPAPATCTALGQVAAKQ